MTAEELRDALDTNSVRVRTRHGQWRVVIALYDDDTVLTYAINERGRIPHGSRSTFPHVAELVEMKLVPANS